jgi:hypothetical protein
MNRAKSTRRVLSLANTRRQASTWSSSSTRRASRASPPRTVTRNLTLPGVDVLAVARDVPPAREHEARTRTRGVENRLGRSGRVLLDPPRGEHDEHPIAPCNGALDHLAVVRLAGNEGNALLERVQLPHTPFPAHAHHLVTPIQRVPNQVPPELARSADDANLHRVGPIVMRG